MSATASGALTANQRTMSLAAVIIAAFGVGASFGVGYPLTALTLEGWGEAPWVIGVAGAAPAVATLAIMPFAPRLIARLGPVMAITLGCAVASIGFLALAASPSAWPWIGVRVIMSAGLAIPWLVGETWINLVAPEQTRGRVIAVYAIAFFTGFAIGPLALGMLGTTGLAPFLAGAIGTVFAGLPILLAWRLAPDIEANPTLKPAAAIRLAPLAMMAAFIGGFAEITYLSLIPSVGLASGLDQSSALRLLSLMTIGGLVMQFPIGWLSDKVSRLSVLGGLAAAFIAMSAALPMALMHPLTAAIAAFAIGGVILGFYTLGLAIMGERVRPADLPAANAGFIAMYQVGAVLGPVAAGVAMTASPVLGFVATLIALMSASALALVALNARSGG